MFESIILENYKTFAALQVQTLFMTHPSSNCKNVIKKMQNINL